MKEKVNNLNSKLSSQQYFSKSEEPSDIDWEVFEALEPTKYILKDFEDTKIKNWFETMSQ